METADKSLVVWNIVPSRPYLEVSDDGVVRRAVAGNSRATRGKIYEQTIKKKRGADYPFVRVYENGKRVHLRVNRLVCEAFHGAPPTNEHHAAHENGNNHDNNQKNLYWATPQENIEDRERHGTTSRGEDHCFAKLTAANIPIIRARLLTGENQSSIAADYGVTIHAIYDIKRGRSWKSV